MKKIKIVMCMMFLMAGCTFTNTAMLNPQARRPSIPWQTVVVYRTASQVPGKYQEVALLYSRQSDWLDQSSMIKSMKKKAAKVGANALILEEIEEPGTAEKIMGEIFETEPQRRGTEVAIYVLPGSETQPAEE